MHSFFEMQIRDLFSLIGAFTFEKDHETIELLFMYVPVSYTHLDVYKRQTYDLLFLVKIG